MFLKPNALNSKKHTIIWNNLINELKELLQAEIRLVFPNMWNNLYFNWFQDIERLAFRQDLRYSLEEVKEKLLKEQIFLLFILSDNIPIACILGNLSFFEANKMFFLDTIAVTNQGYGIGKVLLNYLIKWLKKEKYKGIHLYTEEIDEKKIPLREFYERLGFTLKDRESNGNLKMVLWF